MAAWGAVLSAEQLKDVVAFVVSKKPAAKAAAPADAPK
jgi:mono/diheme cytochrome c family protein